VAVREVLRLPHPDLTQTARALRPDETAVALRVAADLVDTMQAHPRCAGLAAPQIGDLVRVIVVDASRHPKGESANGLVALANPVVVRASGAELGREGCLSVPDLTGNVRRATEVVVEGISPEGDSRVVEARDFEARCFQHELDHLDGILFLDRVESLTADVFARKRYA
jgi:peptide deformylase